MTRSEPNLRIPGPTSLPPSVREAGGRQMINHRGPEFKELLGRLQTGMKPSAIARPLRVSLTVVNQVLGTLVKPRR